MVINNNSSNSILINTYSSRLFKIKNINKNQLFKPFILLFNYIIFIKKYFIRKEIILTIKIILIIVGSVILFLIIFRIGAKLIRNPAPSFIGRFLDSNHRRRLQPPYKIIQASGIKKGIKALEIGCGNGAFTTFVARAVGNDGIVYALDIQPKMLEQLKNKLNRAENKDIGNIMPLLASAYDLPFPDDSLDIVYMVSVFQEIPDKNKTLKEIKRVLKTGGILSISEFFIDPDYPFRSTTVKQGTKGGFEFDGVFGNFWNYTVRFLKPVDN